MRPHQHGFTQDMLLWFDTDGKAYPTPDEIIEATEFELVAECQYP